MRTFLLVILQGRHVNAVCLKPYDHIFFFLVFKLFSLEDMLIEFSFLFFFVFLQKRKGRREGEKHWCERKTSISCLLSLVPTLTGTKATSEACALTRNQTHNILVYRVMLYQLSHTGEGSFSFLFFFFFNRTFSIPRMSVLEFPEIDWVKQQKFTVS